MVAKLLLAHLIADFLLQPNILIKWKNRSRWGVFVHVLIIFVITGLVLMPYLQKWQTWLIITILCLVHFIQDNCKIDFDRRTKHAYVKHFLLDQFGHLIMIIFAGIWLNAVNFDLSGVLVSSPIGYWYNRDYWYWWLSFFLVLVPAWDIFLFQFQRFDNPDLVYRPKIGRLIIKAVLIIVLILAIHFSEKI